MQCQRCPVNGKPLKLSAIQTGRKLIAEEGPLRLFRGVSTMLSASLPAHAVYFSVFEAMKKSFGADSAEHTPIASGTLPVLLLLCVVDHCSNKTHTSCSFVAMNGVATAAGAAGVVATVCHDTIMTPMDVRGTDLLPHSYRLSGTNVCMVI